MKSRFAHFLLLAAFALAMITWGGAAFAQQTQPDTQQPSTQSPPDTTAPSQSPSPRTQAPSTAPSEQSASPSGDTQEFVGTVTKQGSKYVFQDAATGATYDIDHQDEVSKFDGKKVRVHGTLDPSKKMIHVQ